MSTRNRIVTALAITLGFAVTLGWSAGAFAQQGESPSNAETKPAGPDNSFDSREKITPPKNEDRALDNPPANPQPDRASDTPAASAPTSVTGTGVVSGDAGKEAAPERNAKPKR